MRAHDLAHHGTRAVPHYHPSRLKQQIAPQAVFAAFCDSRLAGHWGQVFGTLPANTDFDTIISRAMPR